MMGKNLRMWVVGSGLALVCLLFLAGCQPTGSLPPPPSLSPSLPPTPRPTDTPSSYTTLTVWHSWAADEEQLIRSLLADYQGQHSGIRIRLQRVPAERILTDYEEAVLAGEGPDLLVGRSHWIGRLADSNVIVPLDGILEASFWASLYPFAVEGVHYQGKPYAVPYGSETVALYYNRDFIGEPPTTTVALLDIAANWPAEEQAGLAFPLSFYNTVGYLYAFGGRLFDQEGHAALDSPETRAWLSWLQEVRESPGVIAADSYGQADALFKSSSVAMLVNGSWALADYARALGPDRLGVAQLPMQDQTQAWPTPLVGYRVLMVNPVRLNIYPEAVLDLLRFLGGPLPQSQLAARLELIPTWAEIDLSSNALLQGFVRQAEAGRPWPTSPRIEVLWEPVDKLLYNVTSGRLPIDIAVQETQQQVEQLLMDMEDIFP